MVHGLVKVLDALLIVNSKRMHGADIVAVEHHCPLEARQQLPRHFGFAHA